MASSSSPFSIVIRVRSMNPPYDDGPSFRLSVDSENLEATDSQGRRSVNSRRRMAMPSWLSTVRRRRVLIAQTTGMPIMLTTIMASLASYSVM